jgi:hypothetical protein
MSGLMRRLTRSRAATDDEASPPATAASDQVDGATDAPQGGVAVPANDEPGTAVLPATAPAEATAPAAPEPAPGRDLPAGVDPARLTAVPSSASRGRLRRRLRYLRAVRELLLRDLGGFYYEAQRSEEGIDQHRGLLDAKASRLARLDAEVRDLEARLDLTHSTTVLREPGIGGTCPTCGELHSSTARFCARCGAPLSLRGRSVPAAATPRPATSVKPGAPPAAEDPKATTASLWGRPKRPEPDPPAKAAKAAEPEQPASEPARTGGDSA